MRRWRSDRGQGLIETAILTPLLLLLLLGASDFARVFYTAIKLDHAARAGAQYGAQTNGTSSDSAGMIMAAQQEAQSIAPITVATQQICSCPSGTSVSCTAGSCGTYGPPEVFVRVTTNRTFQTIVPYPLIPNSVSMTRFAQLRVQ